MSSTNRDRTGYRRSHSSSKQRNNLRLFRVEYLHPLRSGSAHTDGNLNLDLSKTRYSTSSRTDAEVDTHLGHLVTYACPEVPRAQSLYAFKTDGQSTDPLEIHSRYPNSLDRLRETGQAPDVPLESRLRGILTVISVNRSEATISMSWRRAATKK